MTWIQLLAVVYLLGWVVIVELVWCCRTDEDGYYLHDSDGETLGFGLLIGAIWPLLLVLLPLFLVAVWLIDQVLEGGAD